MQNVGVGNGRVRLCYDCPFIKWISPSRPINDLLLTVLKCNELVEKIYIIIIVIYTLLVVSLTNHSM